MSYATITEQERKNIYRKLVERYGVTRAVEIMAGNDPEANADFRKWSQLGGRKEGAA